MGDKRISDVTSNSSASSFDSEYDLVRGLDSTTLQETDNYDKYPTETFVEIDYRTYIVEDLDGLLPAKSIIIKEGRLESKSISDKDKNYPFEPIPKHEVRFFGFTSEGRCVFKATHKIRNKHDHWKADKSFDVLFLMADGQFLFRVMKESNLFHHLWNCDCCGNSAAITAGEFGRKPIGRVDQSCSFCCCRKQRLIMRNAKLELCLTVEIPISALVRKKHDEEFECNLDFKFPNGTIYSKLCFKGTYKCFKSKSTIAKWCFPQHRAICEKSSTTIDFHDDDSRLPAELKALVFGAYFLLYHQYWKSTGMYFCPWIFVYILIFVICVFILIV